MENFVKISYLVASVLFNEASIQVNRVPLIIKEQTSSVPVIIVHINSIFAHSFDEAFSIIKQKVNIVVRLMSLLRNASWEIFYWVIINKGSARETKHYPNIKRYWWNLLSENSYEGNKIVNIRYESVKNDPFKIHLLDLYKESLNENNVYFKYVRFWNILIIISKRIVYDKNDILIDVNWNQVLKDNGKPEKLDNEWNIILSYLIKNNLSYDENFCTNLYSLNVNKADLVRYWYAIRNVVIHHGSMIWNLDEVDWVDPKTKYFYNHAISLIKDYGSDFIIWSLESTVVLALHKIMYWN